MNQIVQTMLSRSTMYFVAFCSFFPCSLTVVHRALAGVDNEKALELDNRIYQPDFNLEISPKNATKHPVA